MTKKKTTKKTTKKARKGKTVTPPASRPVSSSLAKAKVKPGRKPGPPKVAKCWRISPTLARKLTAAATREGISASAFVELAIAERLGAKR